MTGRLVDDPMALREYLVRLALEAHDRAIANIGRASIASIADREIVRGWMETEARERMAQVAQVIACEVGS